MVTVGATEILAPVPTNVPPQVPLYHFHEAAVPSEPPETFNVTEVPDVTVAEDVVAAVGATLLVLMVRFKYCVLHPFT